MPSEFDYLNKPVSAWTEKDLRHAQKHPELIREELHVAIDARLEVISANKRLVEERAKAHKREKRLLISFTDTSSKAPASIDVRSVKHAATDATKEKGGGSALTLAGVCAGYDWLSGHPELTEFLFAMPFPVFVAIVVGGAGWWLLLFTKRLAEKWEEKY